MSEAQDEASTADVDLESEDDPIQSLTDEETDDLVEAESKSRPSIGYAGQDFDVAGLVRRLNDHDIVIPTFGQDDATIATAGFQRSFVWTRRQMDRFIESLLLGYPVPGIFLVRQSDRRYLVLDGQQRLRTLQAFKSGVHAGREFALTNVGAEFRGLTYKNLSDEQRRLLEDAFITATIVATDGSKESLESVYQVFERLNTGGTQLTPHEIRVALYAGSFIDYLETLNNDDSWRAVYGKKSPRLRDQELVLRILALYENAAEYKRPLKGFLNDFAAEHRDMEHLDGERLRAAFNEASRLIATQAEDGRLRWRGTAVNAAWTEAVLVGLMRRLGDPAPVDPAKLAAATRELRESQPFALAVTRATADEENVRTRLDSATVAYAGV